MLKILGLSFENIQSSIIIEFVFVAGLAALFGTITSVVMAYLIDLLIFEAGFNGDITTPLSLFLSTLGLSLITAVLATRKRLQGKPSLHL